MSGKSSYPTGCLPAPGGSGLAWYRRDPPDCTLGPALLGAHCACNGFQPQLILEIRREKTMQPSDGKVHEIPIDRIRQDTAMVTRGFFVLLFYPGFGVLTLTAADHPRSAAY